MYNLFIQENLPPKKYLYFVKKYLNDLSNTFFEIITIVPNIGKRILDF